MSKMMRAVVVEEIGQPFVIREVPVPTPGPDEVLVRMSHSGVCPTDMNLSNGEWQMKKPKVPYIPGHEGAGFIEELGSNVEGRQVSERVGVYWLNSTCGRCEDCVTGHENLCMKQKNTGYSVNGTHAEYCLVKADFAVPLPPGNMQDLSAVMCAGVTSYKAVKELNARPGSKVIVTGIGATGHQRDDPVR